MYIIKFMDANGLDPEQQALLASIMGKSSQQAGAGFGGFGSFGAAGGAPQPAAPDLNANSNKQLSQSEIDALIASMTQ